MRSSDVTFRRQVVPIETANPNDDDQQEMDIIEIKYPDGKVVAFPADHKSPETGIKYKDMYQGKYKAFKNGDPDPDRVAQLEREIKERQDELAGMKKKAPDDKRLSENLGYSHSTEPKKIDQPAALGKPAAPVTPAKPAVDPKAKEPA